MIVNGIDIIGYEWVKFVKSEKVYHEIDGKDIILYGLNNSDFSNLFTIINSVPIEDSEYIDVTPGVISKVGSISIQSNSVNPVLLNVILTDTEDTKILVDENIVTIICNENDRKTINLGAISEEIKVLQLGKDYGAELGNIRNKLIKKDEKIVDIYDSSKIYSLNNCFYTNMNYTRALNRLNYEIMKLLPDFDFKLGKIDSVKLFENTVYCSYSQMEVEHRHFFRSLRRNMMHMLPVNYELYITDDIKYAKLQYETSNYDFITNICELEVNDDNDNLPWKFAIHWEIEPFNVDLFDPKTGNNNVARSIKLTANIHLFTSIDNWVSCIKHQRPPKVEDTRIKYVTCHNEDNMVKEYAIITPNYTIVD